MPLPRLKSNFDLCDLDLWPHDRQSWCILCPCPVDHLCQISSKSVHLFSKYCVNEFGNTWTDGWMTGLVERIMTLDWRTHKNSLPKYEPISMIILYWLYYTFAMQRTSNSQSQQHIHRNALATTSTTEQRPIIISSHKLDWSVALHPILQRPFA